MAQNESPKTTREKISNAFFNHNMLMLFTSAFLLFTTIVHFINDLNHEYLHLNIDLEVHHGVGIYAFMKVLTDFSQVYQGSRGFRQKIKS